MSTACALAQGAAGAIVLTYESAQWTSQVGPITTIDFTELSQGEFLTDQYRALGVTFTGTAVGHFSLSAFPTDNQGILNWNSEVIEAQFAAPLTELAIEFGSFNLWVLLYLNDELVASAVISQPGTGPFVGIVSETAFDRLVMTTPGGGGILIDNIYFGAPIPAPGALGLLALAGFAGPRRRRRE